MLVTESTKSPAEELKAAVIDDAFDAIQANEIDIGDLRAAIQTIEADPALQPLFADFLIDKPDLDDVQEDDPTLVSWLNRLWQSTDSETPLTAFLIATVFAKRNEKKQQLHLVCKNIEECGVTVSTYGEMGIENRLDEFKHQGYQLIFVDYYLSPQDDEAGPERAIRVARLINDHVGAEKPVTVLMSSHPNAESQQVKFREKADLSQVAFQFIPKGVLNDTTIAGLVLKGVVSSLDYTNKVHKYILSLSDAAETALQKFKGEIKSLSIDDYVFIQYAKLNKDKHPLGDYMNWLYESRWGSLLFSYEPFRQEQKALDSLKLGTGLLIRDAPSAHIAKMYASALFDEHVEELGPHPQYNDPTKLYLHTGDIFSNAAERQIWLVINPQCDLERDVPNDRSILLVPGKLTELSQPLKDISTDFFQLVNRPFKVSWKVKEVITIAYDSLTTWIAGRALLRGHRLKLPFALQIQQEFSASITRVGTPVSPPIIQQIRLEIWGKNLAATGVEKLTKEALTGVRSIIRTGNQDQVAVTLRASTAIRLKQAIMQYAQQVKTLFDAKPTDPSLQKNLSRLETFINNFDQWFTQNHPFVDKKDASNTINIITDWTGSVTSSIDTLLVIAIKTPTVEDIPTPPGSTNQPHHETHS